MSVSFDFRKRKGSGHFGEVWLATDLGLGCEIALKCIPQDKIVNQSNFFQEAQTLKASEHPNVIHVNETGFLEDGRIYISMEYLPNGSVEDEAQGAPLALSRVKRIMIDMLRGLGHSHEKGILHRDIKPANILIGNSNEGILSDFGLAVPSVEGLNLSDLKKYQYVLHLSPEVRRIQDYTHLSDIYASGVTFFRLVNGDSRLPQVAPSVAHKMAKQGEFPPRNGYRDYIPRSLKLIINKALSIDPILRYQSAEEMRRAIERQNICLDWTEKTSSSHTIWRGKSDDGLIYEVVKARTENKKWYVETKRGSKKGLLRRDKYLCDYNMRKQDADKRARRILQDYVNGKLK